MTTNTQLRVASIRTLLTAAGLILLATTIGSVSLLIFGRLRQEQAVIEGIEEARVRSILPQLDVKLGTAVAAVRLVATMLQDAALSPDRHAELLEKALAAMPTWRALSLFEATSLTKVSSRGPEDPATLRAAESSREILARRDFVILSDRAADGTVLACIAVAQRTEGRPAQILVLT